MKKGKESVVDFLYSNYVLTLLVVITLVVLFVVVTLKVFFDPADIPTGTSATYGTFFGLISLAIGLWKWRRDKSKGKDQETDK